VPFAFGVATFAYLTLVVISAQQITNAIDSSSPTSSPPSRHDYTLRSNEEEYSNRKEALEKKAKFVVITEENCTDFRIY
jgi:hypothetical protein